MRLGAKVQGLQRVGRREVGRIDRQYTVISRSCQVVIGQVRLLNLGNAGKQVDLQLHVVLRLLHHFSVQVYQVLPAIQLTSQTL